VTNITEDRGQGESHWREKSREEKLKYRLELWRNPVGVQFVDSRAEVAYRGRVQRLIDAISLEKPPDRVPVPLSIMEVYPGLRAGMTPYQLMYDFTLARRAFLDFNLDLQPDAMVSPRAGALPGPVYEALDYRLFSWPGHGVSETATFQFNESEYMLAEEYDDFIADPAEFLLRRFLPRICGNLKGAAGLGSSFDLGSMGAVGFFADFGRPEVTGSLMTLHEAGKKAAGWLENVAEAHLELQSSGFPPMHELTCFAPYDYLGDKLRGTRGISLDLYRQPDRVLEACDRLAPALVRWTVEKARLATSPCVFIALHKGSDGFMSDEQFRRFYWPSLRTTMLGLIAEGLIPAFFGEGRLDSRLEVIAADLPPGKTVWLLDRTNMARAKATLGQVAAIQGNVPLSLLQTGTSANVREYCYRLIEEMAPGGGFLLDSGAAVFEAEEENIRAMVQAAHDYGVY
jgi:hypothetical protein